MMGMHTTQSALRRLRGAVALLALALTFAISTAAAQQWTPQQRAACEPDDAPLQPVHPGRSVHLSLHVPLPALSQPRLSRRVLRRSEKESETPLRSPIMGHRLLNMR
jgi:hypothetical protein